MGKYIDKSKLGAIAVEGGDFDGNALVRLEDIRHMLSQAEVDSEPVQHGHWDDSLDGITPYCSVCKRSHRMLTRTPPYCPYCGAKMD